MSRDIKFLVDRPPVQKWQNWETDISLCHTITLMPWMLSLAGAREDVCPPPELFCCSVSSSLLQGAWRAPPQRGGA